MVQQVLMIGQYAFIIKSFPLVRSSKQPHENK